LPDQVRRSSRAPSCETTVVPRPSRPLARARPSVATRRRPAREREPQRRAVGANRVISPCHFRGCRDSQW
jgi:hypothetical protein